MAKQCAAEFVIIIAVQELPKIHVTFRCGREAHQGNDHYKTGVGTNGEHWKIVWTRSEQRRETCLPS
jgi:hypothetical protein